MNCQPNTFELTDGFNKLTQCRYGIMLYNVNDIFLGRSLAYYGEYSQEEMDLLNQIIRPGETVIDVGANIGSHSLFFSKSVGPEGKVLSFEPQRIMFQVLCANMALNSITNAECYNMAIGREPGSTMMPEIDYTRPANFGNVPLGEYKTGHWVQVLNLDSIKLQSCSLVKIDVEGMELEVLKGAVQMIHRFHPHLYIENDREHLTQDLCLFIADLGYQMYWHLPFLYHKNNYRDNPENIFPGMFNINMLCVHKNRNTIIEGLKPVKANEIPDIKKIESRSLQL